MAFFERVVDIPDTVLMKVRDIGMPLGAILAIVKLQCRGDRRIIDNGRIGRGGCGAWFLPFGAFVVRKGSIYLMKHKSQSVI
jgi:hypothetical protein